MIKINYQNIVDNINYITTKYHKPCFFIIKNNAYNMGIKNTVLALTKAKLNYFALTDINSGILARKASNDAYILVMNPTTKEDIINAIKYNLVLSITSYEWYLEHQDLLKNVKLHLKINIGMNRFGLDNLKQINKLINTNKNIEGLFTHFPVSDLEDLTLHKKQVLKFKEFYKNIENKDQLKYIHSENSATLLLNDYNLSFCNYARYGIIGYGYSPTTFDPYLKPALFLTSQIIAIRQLNKDDYLGYGISNQVKEPCTIGILALGYGDGLSKLRSLLPVTINNKQYKIISISMSHTIIKIDSNVKVTDHVEVYGDNHRIDHLLQVCDTTCSIHMASLHT